MQLNCEKNIVKAFHVISQHANSNSCCDLAYSILNNSNLTTRNANSLVTSDLPWHESRNKILTRVHSVIWRYEDKSQFPPQTLTQHPSATLIKTHSLTPTHKSSQPRPQGFNLQLASLGIKHLLGKGVE